MNCVEKEPYSRTYRKRMAVIGWKPPVYSGYGTALEQYGERIYLSLSRNVRPALKVLSIDSLRTVLYR